MRVAAVVLVTTILLGVIASFAAGPDLLAAGPGPQAGPDPQAGTEYGRLTAPQRWMLDRMPRTG